MPDPFTYRFGLDQGRIEPTSRAVDARDNPGPAVLTSLASGPYQLEDQETILIAINGTTQAALFETADFADIDNATAVEVAAAMQADLTGVTVTAVDGTVVVTSDDVGVAATLQVIGGLGQNQVQFPTGLVTGAQGTHSFVLGSERAGEVWDFQVGDQIRVAQTQDVNDALIARVRGHIDWREVQTAGAFWVVAIGVGAFQIELGQFNGPDTYDLGYTAINLSGLGGGAQEFSFQLAVGGAGPDVVAELPAVFVDFIDFDETADALELANHVPHPGMTAVPEAVLSNLIFDILNTTANPTDLGSTRVLVNGQVAYDAGAFVAPFTGSTFPAVGPAGRDTRFIVDASSLAPVASEEVITVQVISTTGVDDLLDIYSFTMEDTVQPTLTGAQARDKTIVRLTFSEAVKMTDDTDGALNAANYLTQVQSLPAVTAAVESVTQVDANQVDLMMNIELSFGATYRITASNVVDLQDNPINPAAATQEFVAFQPAWPEGRSFELWDQLSETDRRSDTEISTNPLRKFVLCFQDVVNLILCDIDKWTEIIDIDLAPEPFVNAILKQLGNPFDFVDELTLIEKRKLGRILLDIYKQKGTEPGIVNAILFFLDVQVELDILNCRDYWQVGVSHLGVNTILAPAIGSPLWYSFYIVSPIILTDQQRERMLKIADYMKPAHEHILGIREPGDTITTPNFWNLGVDLLGATTVLGG